MKLKIISELLFIGTLIACSNSLSIRNFSSEESNDVEPVHTDYAAVARYVVHKSGTYMEFVRKVVLQSKVTSNLKCYRMGIDGNDIDVKVY